MLEDDDCLEYDDEYSRRGCGVGNYSDGDGWGNGMVLDRGGDGETLYSGFGGGTWTIHAVGTLSGKERHAAK